MRSLVDVAPGPSVKVQNCIRVLWAYCFQFNYRYYYSKSKTPSIGLEIWFY
jgi:hypothetical protein